jgi:hypothetical protein
VNLPADEAAGRAFIESTQERFYTRLASSRDALALTVLHYLDVALSTLQYSG